MEQFQVECLVIGAGVVGLAVARELAKQGKEVLLVEQESGIGMQTSSRNSEVIHAGIYYPKGSLKAELCVRGNKMLYQYCLDNNIPHQRAGKFIVAKNATQEVELIKIHKHALENGVEDLRWLDKNQVHKEEPALSVNAALYSPSTGIIDSHAYMLQLQADFERFGGQVVFNTNLAIKHIDKEGVTVELLGQNAELKAKYCVNSAGLEAVNLLQDVAEFPPDQLPTAHYAKGSYFSYGGKVPFSHLIYPVPEVGGLGIHLTLDLSGAAKFGPDVEWLDTQNLDEFDYKVDPIKAKKFEQAIKSYWPSLEGEKLIADYSGIRPKISGPSETSADFMIQSEQQHGIRGLVNLFGIESPGLTASLAIGERVGKLLTV